MIAIGNPFGLGGTVTAGIVSADERMIGAGRYDDFLQIDAPINRGNSGGPTFNLEGEVIGINTAIHSPTGGNVGIGFAIPANLAKRIVDDLRRTARSSAAGSACTSRRSTRTWPRAWASTTAKGALVAAGDAGQPGGERRLQAGRRDPELRRHSRSRSCAI